MERFHTRQPRNHHQHDGRNGSSIFHPQQSRRRHYAYKFLGEGSDTCAGNQLKVSIENSYPEELQTVVSATQIYGSDGRLKGISYTVCAEDYTDANFSDFCLNVVAWLK